jgi:hypothetical protein
LDLNSGGKSLQPVEVKNKKKKTKNEKKKKAQLNMT